MNRISAGDVLSDILDRIAERLGVTAKMRNAIERDARRAWGGERYYIAKSGEQAKQEMHARDAAIYAEFRRGEHAELLARRHGITVNRVRQIVTTFDRPQDGNALP